MSFQKKYIKEPVKLFLNTFKNKKLKLILLIDIIFYIIFYLGFNIFLKSATKIMETLQNLNMNAIRDLNNVELEAANQLMTQLKTFIFTIFGAIFLFALFTIIALTLIKGYQWSKIANKKNELFDYVKLLILNTIWFIIWIIILAIPFLFIEKEAYLSRIYFPLIFIPYFTIFLYMSFAKTKKIGKALIAPIKQGLLRLHKYVAPLIILIIFFEIPFMTLKAINLQNKTAHFIIFLIITIIVLAVYKLYFYTIEKEY